MFIVRPPAPRLPHTNPCQPTERTNAHHPGAPIVPWAAGAQISRVKALLGRRGHLFGDGTEWERPDRVRDARPGDCVQAVKGEVVDGLVGDANKVRGGAGGGRGEKADE
ncbi:hypothetical protein H0H87_011449 [Tephrocybe sp. NHM501043]|nr:hypothetical protein H0H87_011449 [Tephrocybe sp. NHM501043]